MSVRVQCKLCGRQFRNREFAIIEDVVRTVYGDYCRSCRNIRDKAIKHIKELKKKQEIAYEEWNGAVVRNNSWYNIEDTIDWIIQFFNISEEEVEE